MAIYLGLELAFFNFCWWF